MEISDVDKWKFLNGKFIRKLSDPKIEEDIFLLNFPQQISWETSALKGENVENFLQEGGDVGWHFLYIFYIHSLFEAIDFLEKLDFRGKLCGFFMRSLMKEKRLFVIIWSYGKFIFQEIQEQILCFFTEPFWFTFQ